MQGSRDQPQRVKAGSDRKYISLTNNELKRIENFPKMKRLSSLFFCNNYISKISPLGEQIPGLKTLILTNNKIANMIEIDNIASFTKLEILTLLENPVTQRENYRLYVIYKIPSLKSLDFRKVKKIERTEAQRLFTSTSGRAFISNLAEEAQLQAMESKRGTPTALTEEQKRQVRDAIASARTPEDMDRIEKQLKSGTFPFRDPSSIIPTDPEPATQNGGVAEGASQDSTNGHEPVLNGDGHGASEEGEGAVTSSSINGTSGGMMRIVDVEEDMELA